MQFLGRAAEVELFGDGDEVTQVTKFHRVGLLDVGRLIV
jgi:hypothetical protein